MKQSSAVVGFLSCGLVAPIVISISSKRIHSLLGLAKLLGKAGIHAFDLHGQLKFSLFILLLEKLRHVGVQACLALVHRLVRKDRTVDIDCIDCFREEGILLLPI